MWHTGLGSPWHVRSSQTRDQTRVPCIGRQLLNHCTAKEVHEHDSYVLIGNLWRHTLLSPPTSLHWDVRGAHNSHFKKEQSYNHGATREHKETLSTCTVLPGIRQVCGFLGVQSRGQRSRERLHILTHTHRKHPLLVLAHKLWTPLFQRE